MSILGKDLFAHDNNFLRFTARFAEGTVIIDAWEYKLAELVTSFLNYDSTEYIASVTEMKAMIESGNFESCYRQIEKIHRLIRAMPLFCNRHEQHQLLDLRLAMIENYNILEAVDYQDLLSDYFELAEDLLVVQERYSWFVKELFARQALKRDSDQYAWQLTDNNLDAFVSGKNLGLRREVDPAASTVQYELVTASDGTPRLFEKRHFTTLLDFVYTDLMHGLMYGHAPKQCKLCGRFFLQERGFVYEYCVGSAPDESGKTCREVGARQSFRAKVKSSEIWQIHQRAYKKYYARVMKKHMTKAEFNVWAQKAERLRDNALENERGAKRAGREYNYVAFAASLNDR